MGKKIAISIDVAANEFFFNNRYRLYNKEYSSEQLINIYRELNKNYYVKTEHGFIDTTLNDFN